MTPQDTKASEGGPDVCIYGGLEVYTVNMSGKDVADMALDNLDTWERF